MLRNWKLFSKTATKEVFYTPVTGSTRTNRESHCGYRIDAAAETAYLEFYVPHDFLSIVEAVMVFIPYATGTSRLNFTSQYAAIGEARNIHEETLTDQDMTTVNSELLEQDISSILSSLAADDFVGIKMEGDTTNVPNVLILGVRFKYK